ncbi:hypothetical protein [Microbacterium sp. 2FI]|nr:hypothetical protein [Microbacterium sp. 2FI]
MMTMQSTTATEWQHVAGDYCETPACHLPHYWAGGAPGPVVE